MLEKTIKKIQWKKLPFIHQEKIQNVTRRFYDRIVRPQQESRTEYDHDFYSSWYVAEDEIGTYIHMSLMREERPHGVVEPKTILSKVVYLDHSCKYCYEPAGFIQSRDLIDFDLVCGQHSIFGIFYKQRLSEVSNPQAREWLKGRTWVKLNTRTGMSILPE